MKALRDCEIGIIGLGTMGRNLLLNIAEEDFPVVGLDQDGAKVLLVENEPKTGADFGATSDLKTFVSALKLPRVVLLLVPAGAPVDSVIHEIVPHLDPGDLLIDAGNSHFKDTDRRQIHLKMQGIHFFGMGVSGGEVGARTGPSLMPGGDRTAYDRICPILEAIAASASGEPCVTYLGPTSAGHYVKMVHNGIEYGLMQLIAETYYVMKTVLKVTDDECHEIYAEWNRSELSSYLLEITAQVFLKRDDRGSGFLMDVVRDVAKQKGTGKWTCQDAMELQVPVPTMDAAVAVRDLSGYVADRKIANALWAGPEITTPKDRGAFLKQLRNAFYACSIITFAQGMALLGRASEEYGYDLNLGMVARIWRGGCIIRATLLESIVDAYREEPRLSNLLLNGPLAGEIANRQSDFRSIVSYSATSGLPVPGMMASLAYYDSYRSAWLPTNLIQAQRDFFGAHTYERIDRPGIFHSDWSTS